MGFWPFDSLADAFIFGEVVGFLEEDEDDEEKEYGESGYEDEDEGDYW